MSTLNELIIFEHESEHSFEHDLSIKKHFSDPKIYNANGNLKKRWYVYFSFRNPETGKLTRQPNIYGIAHNYKTKEERMSILLHYRRELLKLLKLGFNPYADNSHLLQQIQQEKLNGTPPVSNSVAKTPNTKNIQSTVPTNKTEGLLVKTAFNKALKIKSRDMSPKTISDYKYKINAFLKWLRDTQPNVTRVNHLSLDLMNDFLDYILENNSKRYRNNFRTELGSLMQLMEDREILKRNFMSNIKPLKTKPQRHKRYTKEQANNIFKYLEENDPILLLFIKFVSYNFVRPVEVCRITIGNINFKEKTVQYTAKNSPLKTKRIPSILFDELPDLSKKSDDMFLFTPNTIGDYWETKETNKRNYFSKRFEIVKKKFSLEKNHTIYSFRHTFITKAYRKLEEENSPYEAINKLMQITGHKNRSAVEKYLRDVDAALPNDYSYLLSDE
jgi:integrase